MMRSISRALMAAALLTLSSGAFATPQQERMKECNKEAEGKSGQARKDFMKACLSGHSQTAGIPVAANSQQERMKVCNKQAAGKKGSDRQAFMSDCLKSAY